MWRIWIIITSLLLAITDPAPAQTGLGLHIASFNIHYVVPGDRGDDWSQRRQAVARVLQEMDADIVAFQEMETFEGGHFSRRNLQLDWIRANAIGYGIAAMGQPEFFPNTQPILYKSERFTVLNQGFFFFSQTPDRIYSRQWDGGYPYFCSWARFRHKRTGKAFHVFNVHNDYRNRDNRLKTSKLVAQRIRQTVPKGYPVIVLGDFNAPKGYREIRLIEAEGLQVVPPAGATNRIWGMHLLPAIDHILVSKQFVAQTEVRVWRNRYDGIFPADHYPISVELTWQELSATGIGVGSDTAR